MRPIWDGTSSVSASAKSTTGRPHLDNQRRELVTLAALAAQGGCEKQLAVHIHAALNVGLSREEIVETFIHCVPYLGFPKVLNAVFAAKEVFAES